MEIGNRKILLSPKNLIETSLRDLNMLKKYTYKSNQIGASGTNPTLSSIVISSGSRPDGYVIYGCKNNTGYAKKWLKIPAKKRTDTTRFVLQVPKSFACTTKWINHQVHSDNGKGQNKNWSVMSLWLHLVGLKVYMEYVELVS